MSSLTDTDCQENSSNRLSLRLSVSFNDSVTFSEVAEAKKMCRDIVWCRSYLSRRIRSLDYHVVYSGSRGLLPFGAIFIRRALFFVLTLMIPEGKIPCTLCISYLICVLVV